MRYTSARELGLATVILLGVYAFGDVLRILAAAAVYASTGSLTDTWTEAADASRQWAMNGYSLAVSLGGLLQIATAVVFIIWFRRVRTNAGIFDPHGHRFKRGWAIGGWFVPVGFLWIPRQIAGDCWQASVQPDARGVRPWTSQTLVSLWWGGFVLTRLTDRLTVTLRQDWPDTLRQDAGYSIANSVLEIAAAVLAMLFVHRLTAMQERHATDLAAAAYGPHPVTVG